MLLSACQPVRDGVEESGGAQALALEVDEDDGRVGPRSVVAKLDLLIAEIDGGFVASAREAEGVVFFDLAGGLGEEQLVVVFARREEADSRQVDAEAVERFHAEGVVRRGVIVVFHPVGELDG